VLVNSDADACLAQIRTIVTAERMKRARQIGLVAFVRDLVGRAH
jgi:guanylate kinase